MSPSPRIGSRRTAGLGLAAAACLLAGGCARTTSTLETPAPAASAASAASAVDSPSAASPESERSRARRLAWEAAIAGVREVDGRLAVTDPLAAAVRAAAERDAAEALASNRRTDLVAARVRLVRARPESAAAWNDLGDALRMADRAALAAAAHRSARDAAATGPGLAPSESARAGRALARLAARRGAFAEAVDRMREALAIEDDGDAHARLAVWLMYLGDRPAARAAMADADRLGGRVPATVRARLDEDADGTG